MTNQLLAACGSGLISILCVFWHRNFLCTLQEPFTHKVEQQLTPLDAQRVRVRAPQLIYQAKKKEKKKKKLVLLILMEPVLSPIGAHP